SELVNPTFRLRSVPTNNASMMRPDKKDRASKRCQLARRGLPGLLGSRRRASPCLAAWMPRQRSEAAPGLRATNNRRPFREAGALQMLDQALGNDRRHEFVGPAIRCQP